MATNDLGVNMSTVNFDTIRSAVSEAKQQLWLADKLINQVSAIVAGRLRIAEVDSDVLCELKRELRDFNTRTRKWRKR